tara:strand:+ start:776 stop:1465 length:690 start_codon:yes stop_codon:yes gene_type:complete
MSDYKNIVYSHSDYFDVLDIFLEEQEKFGIEDISICSDVAFDDKHEHFFYSENESYTERLKGCLEQIEDEVVFYQHEDMFLYKFPDHKTLNDYVKLLKNSDYSFIRLCRTGKCILNSSYSNLYNIDSASTDFFAVQPTLWKRKDLIKFLDKAGPDTIWNLELKSNQITHGLKGLMHYNNEPARGGHFDSTVWPYVATAIVKGGWNFREYSTELSRIKKINKSKRQHAVW